MSCFKILVLFVIAQCCAHHILLRKEIDIKKDGQPSKLLAYIHGKWTTFAAKAPGAIQKRELVSGPEILPVEEKQPAPTVEFIEEEKNPELPPTFFGFKRPEFPLTRSIGLNTNIKGNLQLENNPEPIPVPPQFIGELYGGLPPPQPIPAEPTPKEAIVPPPEKVPEEVPKEPAPTDAPPPALFDKIRVRQYAVYAGDVILKYLSQFFNRARLTFNRITSPPPPEPEFKN